MRKLLYLSALILLASPFCRAQSSEEPLEEARTAYANGQYVRAAEAYERAFQQEPGNATQYYNAACAWALAGNTHQAFQNLSLAVEAGWYNLQHLRRDPDLNSLHQEDAWQDILSKVEQIQSEKESQYNQGLKAQLEALFVKDQTLRQVYLSLEQKFGRESPQMDYFWDLMQQEDRKNEAALVAILEEEGWPSIQEVGGKANMAVWLVLQHAPLEVQERFLPLLIASVKRGESSGRHLATLQDRIRVRKDEAQLYGTQFTFDETIEQNIFYPIEDVGNVNTRRAEVDLAPIEEYAKKMKIVWPMEGESDQ
jgi:tetratricopeptide (TPR) repeat protein